MEVLPCSRCPLLLNVRNSPMPYAISRFLLKGNRYRLTGNRQVILWRPITEATFPMKTMVRCSVVAGVFTSVLLLLSAGLHVEAQVVTFNFSGTLHTKLDSNSLLPSSITSTSAFTGTVSYDIGAVPDSAPANVSYGYYIYSGPGLSMSATIAGNTFASIAPSNHSDVFIIHDEQPGTPYDELAFEDSTLTLNKGPLPGITDANMDVDLQDQSSTALNTDARPMAAPSISSFPNLKRFAIFGGTNGTMVYYLEGDISSIIPIQPPLLSITPNGPGFALLSWPDAATNYVLEESLTMTGAWSQVNGSFTTNAGEINLTVPSRPGSKFYRLHAQ